MPAQPLNPMIALRATQEDRANLDAVAMALQATSLRPFMSLSAALRAALRIAATAARRGELPAALARYRTDLAEG